MSAYAMVTVTVKDPETFNSYREQAGAAMAKHGGKPLHVTRGEARVIEGEIDTPDVTVILEFPDRDHANAWITDPDFAEVHALRRASGISNIILM